MKSFLPKRFLSQMPRFVDLLVISIPFYFIGCILDIVLGYQSIYSLALLILILSINLLPTRTIVNSILIDEPNKKIIIKYALFYIINKTIEINFNELSFKFKNIIAYQGFFYKGYKIGDKSYSYFSVLIYKNGARVVKLISRNGWTKEMLDEIIEELNKISPTKISEHSLL